jgi:hypothetical protein
MRTEESRSYPPPRNPGGKTMSIIEKTFGLAAALGASVLAFAITLA